MKKIGKVIHYFDKIGVAVVSLTQSLAVGDTVTIGELTQVVSSMQLDHEPLEKAKKGDEVAIKVDNATKEGTEVEKV
jgi:putative protease